MSAWYRFLKELRKSNEPFTLIFCLPRGRSLNFTLPSWQLKACISALFVISIVSPLSILTSQILLTKQQKLRQELIYLKNEIFAYQTRHDDVYENVYDPELPPNSDRIQVGNKLDPKQGPDTHYEEQSAEIFNQQQLADVAEQTSNPDSLFPETIFPSLALLSQEELEYDHELPVHIRVEAFEQDRQNIPRIRLRIHNRAYPQTLKLRVWAIAIANKESFGEVFISRPHPDIVDWRDGSLVDLAKTHLLILDEESWKTEIQFRPTSLDQMNISEWRIIKVFITDLDGQKTREYAYHSGQLSSRLDELRHSY